MTRSTTPARATTALVAELRSQGVACSPRRIEDWCRVGLVPRGKRRALGRGRGTEVVYPDDMAERCRRVAERMRRGQPWQIVALGLFGAGADLPEDTIRAAYHWALSVNISKDGDELDTAERGVERILSTVAGRRLEAVIAAHVKRSGVAPGESPSAVARSVLTNVMLIPLGGEVTNDEALVETFAGLGFPIDELSQDERNRAAQIADDVLGAFSFDALAREIGEVPIDELKSALPMATRAPNLLPADFRRLLPRPVVELLPTLLAPVIVQFARIAEGLLADQKTANASEVDILTRQTTVVVSTSQLSLSVRDTITEASVES